MRELTNIEFSRVSGGSRAGGAKDPKYWGGSGQLPGGPQTPPPQPLPDGPPPKLVDPNGDDAE